MEEDLDGRKSKKRGRKMGGVKRKKGRSFPVGSGSVKAEDPPPAISITASKWTFPRFLSQKLNISR